MYIFAPIILYIFAQTLAIEMVVLQKLGFLTTKRRAVKLV